MKRPPASQVAAIVKLHRNWPEAMPVRVVTARALERRGLGRVCEDIPSDKGLYCKLTKRGVRFAETGE